MKEQQLRLFELWWITRNVARRWREIYRTKMKACRSRRERRKTGHSFVTISLNVDALRGAG